jgi:hypothetical protein
MKHRGLLGTGSGPLRPVLILCLHAHVRALVILKFHLIRENGAHQRCRRIMFAGEGNGNAAELFSRRRASDRSTISVTSEGLHLINVQVVREVHTFYLLAISIDEHKRAEVCQIQRTILR